ncbi:MAG: hypothetical protein GY788_11280 [bacterium]|nr:hypothetical protein [bacterium]
MSFEVPDERVLARVPAGRSSSDPLQPSTTYVTLGFEYLTEAAGMPARVRRAFRLVSASDRIWHATAQRGVSLGGFASGPNLFPQAGNFNLSSFVRLEHSGRQVLRHDCAVEAGIVHPESDDRYAPLFLVVTHWEDGTEETLPSMNEGHVL